MKGVDLTKIASLIYMDDLDYVKWDNAVYNPRYKNLVHGLRNSLMYAVERRQLKGLMKKLFKEFMEEMENKAEGDEKVEMELLKEEIKRFLKRHKVEVF